MLISAKASVEDDGCQGDQPDKDEEEAQKRKADYDKRHKESREAKKAAKLAEETGFGFSGDKGMARVDGKMKMTAVKETMPKESDDDEKMDAPGERMV